MAFKKIVQKFEMGGRNKENSGRRVTACTKMNIGTVHESTVRNLKKLEKRSSELGLQNLLFKE